MTSVQCQVEIPNVQGLKENELTVGREFLLVCEGEFPKDLVQEKLHFILKPEEKYILKLKSFEFRSPTTADLKVTSYTAGQFQFPQLQLTDDKTTLELGSIGFTVQTVMEKPQPSQTGEAPKKPEPYGPIGPATIGIPQNYWIALAVILAVLTSWLGSKIYRVVQRRRLLEDLKKHDSALSPISEFYANLRKLQRYNTVFFGGEGTPEDISTGVIELQRMLRLYLTRQYRMPALEWSPRLVVQDLKKYHPRVHAEEGVETQKLLNEFVKAQQAKNKVKTSDVLNLSKRTRLLIEGMEKLR